VSEISINIAGLRFDFPIPTNWVIVYGTEEELSSLAYIFDRVEQDGSLHDQEQLRKQITAELPRINIVSRLYEDEIDLTSEERIAAPVEHRTADRLQIALNAGQHFVSLSGHGNSDGCCGYSVSMARNLTNGFHAFIGYADSCLTNQFDDQDAVSEVSVYTMSGGAVAYIGNTRFSWIGVGDNFQRVFFHRMTSARHLGVLNDTRCGMVNEPTGFWRLYNKWAIFTLNLMGDPEMPVWIGSPLTMKVAFQPTLDKRKPLTVTVTRPFFFMDMPLKDATVHIQQGGFSRIATTDMFGKVEFNLNSAQLGNLEIVVTREGFIPFIGNARITGPYTATGVVSQLIHKHGAPSQSLVRLELDEPIDGIRARGWYARNTLSDYSIILDAVTDAYVSGKKISLTVDNLDEGGTIERFQFG
jgi:hypothetical protein